MGWAISITHFMHFEGDVGALKWTFFAINGSITDEIWPFEHHVVVRSVSFMDN